MVCNSHQSDETILVILTKKSHGGDTAVTKNEKSVIPLRI